MIKKFLVYIFISFLLLGGVNGLNKQSNNIENNEFITDSIGKIVLLNYKYEIIKADLEQEIDSFLICKAPTTKLKAIHIIDNCIEANYFDIILLLTQGFKESHYGTTGKAKYTNSVFNVGAYDNMTLSQINGKYKYNDVHMSIKPYITLMNTKYLKNKTTDQILNNFVNVNGHRYASAPDYEVLLRYKYNKIKNTTTIFYKYNELVKLHKILNK